MGPVNVSNILASYPFMKLLIQMSVTCAMAIAKYASMVLTGSAQHCATHMYISPQSGEKSHVIGFPAVKD